MSNTLPNKPGEAYDFSFYMYVMRTLALAQQFAPRLFPASIREEGGVTNYDDAEEEGGAVKVRMYQSNPLTAYWGPNLPISVHTFTKQSMPKMFNGQPLPGPDGVPNSTEFRIDCFTGDDGTNPVVT